VLTIVVLLLLLYGLWLHCCLSGWIVPSYAVVPGHDQLPGLWPHQHYCMEVDINSRGARDDIRAAANDAGSSTACATLKIQPA
jgi:hypothetical protein